MIQSALVVGIYGAFYEVLLASASSYKEILLAKLLGKLRLQYQKTTSNIELPFRHVISIGDYVEVRLPTKKSDTKIQASIVKILPQKNMMLRCYKRNLQVLGCNIDSVLIFSSVTFPRFNSGFINRVLTEAYRAGVQPVIIINKFDLFNTLSSKEKKEISEEIDFYKKHFLVFEESFFISISNKFRNFIKYKSVICIGQSGVGKSTCLNTLLGTDFQKIGVKQIFHKGAHTTTNPKMFFYDKKSFFIDLPGIKEYSVMHISLDIIRDSFVEFDKNVCHFKNCMHLKEPNCFYEDFKSTKRYQLYCSMLKDTKDLWQPK